MPFYGHITLFITLKHMSRATQDPTKRHTVHEPLHFFHIPNPSDQ